MWIIVLISILWYLIGSIGGLLVLIFDYKQEINTVDILFFFTIGGIGGLSTVFMGLDINKRFKR